MAKGTFSVRDKRTKWGRRQTHLSVDDEVHGGVHQEGTELHIRHVWCRDHRRRRLSRGVARSRGQLVRWWVAIFFYPRSSIFDFPTDRRSASPWTIYSFIGSSFGDHSTETVHELCKTLFSTNCDLMLYVLITSSLLAFPSAFHGTSSL